ncbi:MAG: T9SS type A sorting domain-containing protein, partial [Syntrophothermus sp.]
YVVNRKSKGTGKISISKVNPLEITGHDYSVTFDSLNNTALVYNVKDITTGKQVLFNQTDMDGKAESGYFDGLRLIVRADTVEVIDSLSGLRSAKSNFIMPIAVNSNKQYSIRLPYDYELDFTGSKTIPSFDGNKPPDGPRVNFIARNITRGDTVNVLVNDKNGDYILNPGEDFTIVEFIDKNNNGIYEVSERKYNWQISYQRLDAVPVEPAAGDKFLLTVNKPFIKGDQITFSTKKLTGVAAGKPVPAGYYLSQNYPNPFNPATTISYGISRQSFVELSVYDLLSKKIMTLVNKTQSAGSYQVRFDGSSLPSGLYIYKLKAGDFVDSKKLMLIK